MINEDCIEISKEELTKALDGYMKKFPILYNKFCCIHPPGDGSTCAGGECCCDEDYTCDKCSTKDIKLCCSPEGEPCVGEEGNK